jgi:hypothetical protein
MVDERQSHFLYGCAHFSIIILYPSDHVLVYRRRANGEHVLVYRRRANELHFL